MPIIHTVNINRLSPNLLNTLIAHSSIQRQERAARFRFLPDKARCLVAGLLLDHALATDFGLISGYRLGFGPHGKPILLGDTGGYFNLSHSGDLVVCATSERPVGVDVETLDAGVATIGCSRFSANEREYIEHGPHDDRVLRFTTIWTRKEAYLKYQGCGLTQALNTFSVITGDGMAGQGSEHLAPSLTSLRDAHCRHVLSSCDHDTSHTVRRLTPAQLINNTEGDLPSAGDKWLPVTPSAFP